MFDVDWADYEIERVGQRRVRKEVERDLKKKDERRSVRESVSSRSSLSSGEKSQGFLGSLGLKISSASLRGKRLTPNTLQVPADDGASKRASILSQTAVTPSVACSNDYTPVSEDKLCVAIPPIGGLSLNTSTATSDNSTNRSSKGSVLSKSTGTTALTIPSPCKSPVVDSVCTGDKITPVAEPGFLVTKTTETKYELKDDAKRTETQVVSVRNPLVHSASFHSAPSYSAPSSPSSPIAPNTDVSASLLIDKWFTSVNSPGSPLSPVAKDESANGKHPQGSFDLESTQAAPDLNPPSPIANKTARSPRRKNTTSSARLRANNPDAWKPPDNWNCQLTTDAKKPASQSPSPFNTSPRKQDAMQYSMALDLTAMQREVARMAAASAEIVVVRLNENWGNSSDASFYRELEMEKKRWMLSALQNMRMYTEGCDTCEIGKDSGQGQRMLALFESQATTSYLAAIHPGAQFTHMSPQPLSQILFPNVQPLPLDVGGLLPLPSNRFSKVYCLGLPSMMPSQSIPRLLQNVHRCLAPKGILHLTVIDPSPATQSLGPRMRHWLDQNLMLNLETQFRCISPSRLLPAWLADARLRADGSVISKMKFDAVYRRTEDDVGAEAELRSTVGRKLWQEVWGSFVHAAAWWWDDPACIEECIRLGTYFEYSLIEAVKDTV